MDKKQKILHNIKMFFYLKNPDLKEIKSEESSHFFSMRIKQNDVLKVTNLAGVLYEILIQKIDKKNQTINFKILDQKKYPAKEKKLLLQAKTDKLYLEKIFEIIAIFDITEIIIFGSDFSEKKQPVNLERLEKICIRCCEQSQQVWMPKISFYENDFEKLLADFNPIVLEENGIYFNDYFKNKDFDKNLFKKPFCVGPEGGFSENEKDLIKNSKTQTISLGKNVLPSWLAGYSWSVITKIS